MSDDKTTEYIKSLILTNSVFVGGTDLDLCLILNKDTPVEITKFVVNNHFDISKNKLYSYCSSITDLFTDYISLSRNIRNFHFEDKFFQNLLHLKEVSIYYAIKHDVYCSNTHNIFRCIAENKNVPKYYKNLYLARSTIYRLLLD